MPQITVKNDRPKLPRVFLILLTLITPELDPCPFIVLAVFYVGRGSEESTILFMRFNFDRYTLIFIGLYIIITAKITLSLDFHIDIDA